MSVRQVLNRFLRPNAANNTIRGTVGAALAEVKTYEDLAPAELSYRTMCRLLHLFYFSNGLYESLADANVQIARSTAQIRAIRNPVPSVVDFFGAKMWPVPLVVKSKQEGLNEALIRVWKWSNWKGKSREFARLVSLLGEGFIKVVGDVEKQRVWFEYIEATYVSDYEEDARGYLTWVRVCIPFEPRTGPNAGKQMSKVEIWSKDEGTVTTWEVRGDAYATKVKDLGTPLDVTSLADFGIDFVPIVRVPFKQAGGRRALGAVQLQIETIVEGDLSATNLHGLVFQEADGATVLRSEGVDANNRPLPPPVVETFNGAMGTVGSDGSILVGKKKLFRLPGNQRIEHLIPNINYEAVLQILQDHDNHLKRIMPALAYAEITELTGADLSGRAIRFKLTPAIDQVEEARGVGLEKLALADQMAITIGQHIGIDGFDSLGTFEAGDLEHEFEEQDVFPLGSLEKVQEERDLSGAFATWIDAGLPVEEALRRVGYSEDKIAAIAAEIQRAKEEAEKKALELAQTTGGNQNGQPGNERDAATNPDGSSRVGPASGS